MTKTTIEREWQLSAHETDNDYLHHEAFSPVDKEITAVDLDSVGDIPRDIDGVYVRNGHNPIYQPRSGRYHWFDGDGMIHDHFQQRQGYLSQPYGYDRGLAG